MKIRLYFDEDSMRRSLLRALRARGVNVITALDAEMIERKVRSILITQLNKVAYCTFNAGDFYRLHTDYIAHNKSHAGIILMRQQHYSVGEQMRRLLRLMTSKSAEDMKNWVEFLSAWNR